MTKSLVAFAFLPLVAACATTPQQQQVQTAADCRMVPNDDPGSKIKERQECDSPSQGSAMNPEDASSRPAPQ